MIAHATIWEFVHILVELKSVAMCLTTDSTIFFKACLFFTAKLNLNVLVLFLQKINYEVRCNDRAVRNRKVTFFAALLLSNEVLK